MTREEFAALQSQQEKDAPKPSKYSNKKTIVDGIKFDSQHEADVWSRLRLLEKAGKITDLQCQVQFPIVVNGLLVCTYVADYTFTELSGSLLLHRRRVVGDAKGKKTRMYNLKKKLMKAVHGIDIREY